MSDLILPPGMVCGLDLRTYDPGEVCGFAREKILGGLPPRRDWKEILANPERVRMTRYVKSVYDQNGYPSCASESSTGMFKTVRDWAGSAFVEFNPLVNFFYVQGRRGGGSSLDSNLERGRDYGYCPESVFPRSNGLRRPSDDALDAAKFYRGDEFDEVETAEEGGGMLLCGHPFSFGWKGHSCVAMEMIDEEWFWYLNSWRYTWGEKPYDDCSFRGFGRLRLRDIDFRYGAYAFLTTTSNTTLSDYRFLVADHHPQPPSPVE